MRLSPRCIFVTITTCFLLSAYSGALAAQESTIVHQVCPELPDAPQPQFALAEAKSSAQQSSSEIEGLRGSHQSASNALKQNLGVISGTVTDMNGDIVPGSTVILDEAVSGEHRETVANDNAAFAFEGIRGNISYRVSIRVPGLADWSSPIIILTPGQLFILSGVRLTVEGQATSVTVYGSTEQVAVEQVRIEEQQRVLGIVPNFYVVYDSKNAVPLPTKLKFKLAMRVSTDPVTWGGVAFMAGIKQAANTPDYVQGAKGYGQRIGTVAADNFSDIMLGGAILPSLLHQDPRYFYQGTGTTKSRLGHALSSPFICRGDNGQWQPNYSSLGGDLGSSALSNAYYPDSNRGVGLTFSNFAIGTLERMASDFAQEFIFPRFTPGARKK